MTAADSGETADDVSAVSPDGADTAPPAVEPEAADTAPAADGSAPTAADPSATDSADRADSLDGTDGGAVDPPSDGDNAEPPAVDPAVLAARDQLEASDDPVGTGAQLIAGLAAERAEFLDAAQRARADLDNLRKRTERDRVVIVERAEERLVTQLLEVLDALDLAATHHPDEVAPIQSKLLATLGSAGLTVVSEVDAPFDPNHHQAVETESGDVETDTVAAVHRPGYLWHGRLLRPALVKVRQPE